MDMLILVIHLYVLFSEKMHKTCGNTNQAQLMVITRKSIFSEMCPNILSKNVSKLRVSLTPCQSPIWWLDLRVILGKWTYAYLL